MMDDLTLARIRKERDEAIRHSNEAPGKFLSAWVQGVRLVGEGYFTNNPNFAEPAASLDKVISKWQLIPDQSLIEERIGVLSGGEAALLAVMCSFYNSEWGGGLMRNLGLHGMADVSAKLDLQGNKIIAGLLINYTGW